jgi:tetratricopeptide (TPR) repeat protein
MLFHRSRELCCRIVVLAAVVPSMGGCGWLWGPSRDTVSERRTESQIASSFTEQGRKAMAEGNIETALAAFRFALERDPNQLDAHLGIGDIHQIRGDYVKAADEYAVAVQKQPTNFDANYKLGLIYHLLNRVRDAITTYLSALAINPNSFDANLNLATAYLQIRQPALALPYAEKAVQLNADSQAARINCGAVYSALGRDEDAVLSYRSAADLGEISPQLAVNLANALIKVGGYQRAINTLETVIRRDPKPEYYERLGYAYFKLGEFDQSMEAYERSLKMLPDDPAALNGLGVNLMTRYIQTDRREPAMRDRAIDAWQRSIRKKPDQPKIVDLISRYRGI